MARILIVDDDPSMATVLTETFRSHGHEVVAINDPAKAFEFVRTQAPDLVLTDIEMPEGQPTGLKLLSDIKEHDRSIPVIIITGHATKERAVAALRAGAQDFIEKPFRLDELTKRAENALVQREGLRALAENVVLKKQLTATFQCDNIVGCRPVMQPIFRLIKRIADTDTTILILGESGTGKELVAKALHHGSRRAAHPFIAVNCAALPEHLLESELFGHRKGAFTGAALDRAGLFQAADGGTVFLDEIGSMPVNLQSKLLRFLQDKEVRRVGDTESSRVDVRVLAATNEPLEQRLRDRTFREDLYYRLNVIPISLPALRQRPDDIPLLAAHFIEEITKRQDRPAPRLGEETLRIIQAYAWPGNVRELQNVLERACVLCDGTEITAKDLPDHILSIVPMSPPPPTPLPAAPAADEPLLPLKEYLHLQTQAHIQRALRVADSNRAEAARMLGVSATTLYRKMHPDAEEGEGDDVPPAT